MSKSDYLENAVLDEWFGGVIPVISSTYYVALYTVEPTDAGGGTEVSGGGYARVAYANDLTNWPAAVAGVKSNGTTVQFGTTSTSWGTVVAFALFDDITAGNEIIWSPLTAPILIDAGEYPAFAPGSLSIVED